MMEPKVNSRSGGDWAAQLKRNDHGLRASVVERTLVVRLNRPEASNALDLDLIEALESLWKCAAATAELRCIVVTGSGKAFCAGADMSMLAAPRTVLGDDAEEELRFLPGHQVPVPVIALVNGACAGGGLHFVADADIVVAGRSSWFTDPHVSVGQVTGLEPLTLRLRMRPDALTRLALLGNRERIDSTRALECGLVSEVVDDADLLQRGLELGKDIASNSREAVRVSRRILRTFERRLLASDLDLAWELIQRHRSHPDALEGPAAFIEKRSPTWAD